MWYRPGHPPENAIIRRLFRILYSSFSRQIGILSGVPDTVLGLRPTKGRIVRFFVIFGVHLPDRCGNSRVNGHRPGRSPDNAVIRRPFG